MDRDKEVYDYWWNLDPQTDDDIKITAEHFNMTEYDVQTIIVTEQLNFADTL